MVFFSCTKQHFSCFGPCVTLTFSFCFYAQFNDLIWWQINIFLFHKTVHVPGWKKMVPYFPYRSISDSMSINCTMHMSVPVCSSCTLIAFCAIPSVVRLSTVVFIQWFIKIVSQRGLTICFMSDVVTGLQGYGLGSFSSLETTLIMSQVFD